MSVGAAANVIREVAEAHRAELELLRARVAKAEQARDEAQDRADRAENEVRILLAREADREWRGDR